MGIVLLLLMFRLHVVLTAEQCCRCTVSACNGRRAASVSGLWLRRCYSVVLYVRLPRRTCSAAKLVVQRPTQRQMEVQ